MNYKFLLPVFLLFISFTLFSQQLEKMVLENWEDGAWMNKMQELPFYDEEGRLIRKEISHWDVTSERWELQTKTEFTYNDKGVLILKEIFKWEANHSTWQPDIKVSSTINDENEPNYVITEIYREGNWNNQSLDEYEYDSKGELIGKQLSHWDASSFSWSPYSKYNYRIESNRKMGYTSYFWNNKLENWRSFKRASYKYHQEGQVDQIHYETWLDGKWKNQAVRKDIRDQDGVRSAMEVNVFEDGSDVSKKSTQVDYELTDFGKISKSISKKWMSETESWKNIQRSTYSYKDNREMSDEEMTNEIALFPNPATEELTIRSLPKGQLTVLDVLGKVILQSDTDQGEMRLDLSQWEMGTYSVWVNGKEVQQFVKQ